MLIVGIITEHIEHCGGLEPSHSVLKCFQQALGVDCVVKQ